MGPAWPAPHQGERMRRFCSLAIILSVLAPVRGADEVTYVRKATRAKTILASLQASGLPTLEGKWHCIGPFDNHDGLGFDTAYPPEREIDRSKTYAGKGNTKVRWEDFPRF